MTPQNILLQEIVQKLGWTLLHFVWQAVVVALLLVILLAVLRKSSASMRYIISCVALGLIVLLPIITLQLIKVSTPQPPVNVEPAPAPFVLPVEPSVETPLGRALEYMEMAQPKNVGTAPKIHWKQQASELLELLLPYIVVGWLLGVFGLSLWHLGGWTQLQRLKKQMIKRVDTSLQAKLNDLSDRLKVKRAVQLLESALVQVPTVVGWLRPVILLPASALTGLTAEQLEALLAHELAHIRRYDYLVNMLQTVVETLGFYHPAVWWISHRIRAERENCCDDLAVSISGDCIRYAKALASMEEIRTGGSKLAVAATEGSLFDRIRRLVNKESTDGSRAGWIPSVITILLMTIIVIPTTLALNSRAEDKIGDGIKINTEGQQILKQMAERNSYWLIGPPAEVRNYSYDFNLHSRRMPKSLQDRATGSKSIEVENPSKAKKRIVQGITYSSVLQKLAINPSTATITRLEHDEAKGRIRLDFTLSEPARMECGNGISGLYLGKFSMNVSSGSLWLDAKNKDPIELEAKNLMEQFSEYVQAGKSQYVPLRIGIHRYRIEDTGQDRSMHFEFKFSLFEPGLWLFDQSSYQLGKLYMPSINKPLVAYISNIKINSTPKQKTDIDVMTSNVAARSNLKELDLRSQSIQNLLFLSAALKPYTKDHDGNYPDNLEAVRAFAEEYPWILEQVEYLGKGKTTAEPSDTIIAYDSELLNKIEGTNVLLNDSRIVFLSSEQLKDKLQEKASVVLAGNDEGRIEGKIVDIDTGGGISGVQLVAVPNSSRESHEQFTCTTAEDGTFTITGLKNGEYLLQGDFPSVDVGVISGRSTNDVFIGIRREQTALLQKETTGEKRSNGQIIIGSRLIQMPADATKEAFKPNENFSSGLLFRQGHEIAGRLMTIAQELKDAKLLIAPQMLLNNNSDGTISIIKEEFFIHHYEPNESEPGKLTPQRQPLDVGWKFKIFAEILGDGEQVHIKMVARRQKSGFETLQYRPGYDYQIPSPPEIFATDFIAKNGEPVVIGRLIRNETAYCLIVTPSLILPEQQPEPLLGKKLPEPDNIKNIDSLEPEGKRILVCFWDSQQRPSRNLVGELAKREKELAGKNIAVLLVDTSGVDPAKLKEWLGNRNIAFPCGSIKNNVKDVLIRWGVQAQPWLILTDKNRVVQAEGFGLEQLDETLQEASEPTATGTSKPPSEDQIWLLEQLDEEDAQVHKHLEKIVDLSDLSPGMSFGEVIRELEKTAEPPLQIWPNWQDMRETAGIVPTTPVGMNPLTNVKLGKALEILLACVSSESAKVSYVVDGGVVVIATAKALPKTMVVRVYDITDLVGDPEDHGGLSRMMQTQNLVDFIQERISPDSWYDLNITSEGTTTPFPIREPKKLAVFQTLKNQRAVQNLLEKLRSSAKQGNEELPTKSSDLSLEKERSSDNLLAKSPAPSAEDKSIVKVGLSVVEVPSDSRVDNETTAMIRNLLDGKITIPDSPAAADLLRNASEATAPVVGESTDDKRVTQKEFKTLFDLLTSRGYVKILMNPTLEVVEGQAAQIKTDQNSLEVTANGVKDDIIYLTVQAELTSQIVPGGEGKKPMISRRSFASFVSINSGQSQIIGGTIQPAAHPDTEGNAKVPQTPAGELLCIVTASIITPPDDAKQQDKASIDKNQVFPECIQLKYYRASDADQVVRPLLGKAGSVSFDQKTNIIIIIDTAENLKRIEKIITALEASKTAQPGETKQQDKAIVDKEYEVIQLSHINANEAAERVNKVISQLPEKEFRPSVRVQPLEDTGQIIVFGRKDLREIVKKLIAQLDMPSGLFETKTFQLKYAYPDLIKEKIEGSYKNPANEPQEAVRVIAFPKTKQVTVIASPENLSRIAEQIAKWDTFDVFKPRIIELQNSDPVQMAGLLTKLFSEEDGEGVNIRDVIPGEDIAGPLSDHFTFEDVPETSKIIVMSNIPKAYDAVGQLILELDKQKMATKDVKQVREWIAGLVEEGRLGVPKTTDEVEKSEKQKEAMETVNFQNAEAKTVIEKLAEWTGKTIIPPDELMKQKITIYVPQKIPRSEAAAMILDSLRSKGYTAEQTDDTIYLKPLPEEQHGTEAKEPPAGKPVTRVYDIYDLVLAGARISRGAVDVMMDNSGIGSRSHVNFSDQAIVNEARKIVNLIRRTIDPNSWYENNPKAIGIITPYPAEGPRKLAIYQTLPVHQQIQKLLASRREQIPTTQISIELRYLYTNMEFLDEVRDSMGIEFTSGTVLDDKQLGTLLRASQKKRDIKSLMAPGATVLNNVTARFNASRYIFMSFLDYSKLNNHPKQSQPVPVDTFCSITPQIEDNKNILIDFIQDIPGLQERIIYDRRDMTQSYTDTIAITNKRIPSNKTFAFACDIRKFDRDNQTASPAGKKILIVLIKPAIIEPKEMPPREAARSLTLPRIDSNEPLMKKLKEQFKRYDERKKDKNQTINQTNAIYLNPLPAEQSDTSKAHIQIDTKILTVSDEFLKSVGLDPDSLEGTGWWSENLLSNYGFSEQREPIALTFDEHNVNLLLKAVQSRKDYKLLTHQEILAKEGKQTEIPVVSQAYFIEVVYDLNKPSKALTAKTGKLQFGTFIRLTPELTPEDNKIALDLEKEVRLLRNFDKEKYKGESPEIPPYAIYNTKSRIIVSNGDTLPIVCQRIAEPVLLTKQEVSHQESLWRNINPIRAVFRKSSSTEKPDRILILIKPEVPRK